MGVGKASFLLQISQQFLPVLEGIGVEKVQIEMRQVPFHN